MQPLPPLSTRATGLAGETRPEPRFRFAVDRGGTFTDVFAEVRSGGHVKYEKLKLLSEDPDNYADAPTEGIRRILEAEMGQQLGRTLPVATVHIDSIRMGTTVATNALLERRGERTALVVTRGFADLLEIGNQTRSDIFALNVQRPDLLYEVVVELDEDVILPLGNTPSMRNGQNPPRFDGRHGRTVVAKTGEQICVRQSLDMDQVRGALQQVADEGISSVAVVLKHAALFADHEAAVGEIARSMGFRHVSLSHAVMPMVKMVPRGFTAAADAYLTPHIRRYLDTFQAGFDAGLDDVELIFMQSDGGLSPADAFSGHKAVLSGPAGGYVGYAATTKWDGMPPDQRLQVIGFDMGGTSTDVSRYDGEFEHVLESTTAGVTIQAPQLDINTVAAGGGSRLFYRDGVFAVGPESAGAHPGPVCYRKGGHLAVTDANAALGRIVPAYFPRIFGPGEDLPLDAHGAKEALQELTDEVNRGAERAGRPPKAMHDVALGFLDVANEAMCRPIRSLTQARGLDVGQHVLACFGGAGGQHACAVARRLGMRTVFVHKYASILSAVGMGLASIVQEAQEPAACELVPSTYEHVEGRLDALSQDAVARLKSRGFPVESIHVSRYLNLRFQGTDVALMVAAGTIQEYFEAFMAVYQRDFGFVLEGRPVIVDDVRVRASAAGAALPESSGPSDPGPLPHGDSHQAYFAEGGWQETPILALTSLRPGHTLSGPAILLDDISTIVVEPLCTAHMTADGSVRIDVGVADDGGGAVSTAKCDPIQLAIFSHRFMSIAEQMGRSLQRSSISVNIKERLDFSCALFGPDGSLVANAPHLPVHLGAMSEAVRAQIRFYTEGPGREDGLREGDTLVTNHPVAAGGSHLPDITVITPVWDSGCIVFFVASRGHHADVGGTSPGSMPPHSKTLVEEGAMITSFKLVRAGTYQEEGIMELLQSPAQSGVPGVVGTRCMSDNLSDLRAQVAANAKGISLVRSLIAEYTLPVVQAYMAFIQSNAEEAVRAMLVDFSISQGLGEIGTVRSEDRMDDGTPIRLAVTIDRAARSATFDFGGTGPQVFGNTNAPPAVTFSAVIYSLRCLVSRDIPLNGGCLAPVTIKVPPGSLLSPSEDAAVVGGNVLTSQRITDVVLKAFKAMACSYGCMNNFTFGDAGMGYYETIAGGGGAGPGFDGCSGIQMHMTNTRITDVEVLERYYPVSLRQFALRPGSGGAGQWHGGCGVVREVEFLRPLQVAVLSERRALAPEGLLGGGQGARGKNLLIRASGQVINLGGKATVQVNAGDRIRICTPGGGGFGNARDRRGAENKEGTLQAQEVPLQRVALQRGSVADWVRIAETA